MPELTGPGHCAECGTELSIEVAFAGDAAPLVIPTGDDLIEVPGLYICTNCAGEIMVGERERTVTPERAVKFLTENYVPKLAMAMTDAHNEFALAHNRFIDCAQAAHKLNPEVRVELGVIELGDDD